MATKTIARDGTGDYNCDGTDDSATIQQALDYAHSNAGTTLYFKAGTYQIDTPLTIYSNTTVIGEVSSTGALLAKLQLKANCNWPNYPLSAASIFVGGAVSTVDISYIEIDGNSANQSYIATLESSRWGKSYHNHFYFINSSHINIHDCYLHHGLNDGLRAIHCDYVYFYNNTCYLLGHEAFFIDGNGYADGCDTAAAHHNTITIRADGALRADDALHVKFYENIITASPSGNPGIQIGDHMGVVDDVEIYNNSITGTIGPGIWLNDLATATNQNDKHVWIHHNDIIGCGLHTGIDYTCGVLLRGFNGTRIEYNNIDNSRNAGVLVRSASTGTEFNVYIRNNIISDTVPHTTISNIWSGYGAVNLYPTNYNLVLENNTMSGNSSGNFYGCTGTLSTGTSTGDTTTPARVVPSIRLVDEEDRTTTYIAGWSSYVNGYPIKVKEYRVDTDQSISTDKPPGFDGNVYGDFGADGANISLKCFGYGKEDVRGALAAWKQRGRVYLELGGYNPGWQVSGIVRAHTSRISKDSWQDMAAEYDPYSYEINMYCDEPYESSIQGHVRARTLTYSGEQFSEDNTFAGNLVKNASFENWTAQGTSTITFATEDTTGLDDAYKKVCYSPELGLFAAAGPNGIVTSTGDGNWTLQTTPSGSWYGICWSPDRGMFVAVAQSGVNQIAYSTDGTTWTAATCPAVMGWCSVCWSPELELFVAVAYSGTGNRVMYSETGIDGWTQCASADDSSAWVSVCWSPELELFCAVAYSGTEQIMTSATGIDSWTAATAPEANNWYSVCWSSKLGMFAAVATTGTNRIMTSTTGTWTWDSAAAPVANAWYAVTWAPELELFIACSYGGSQNCIMTSATGTGTWTSRATPAGADNNWTSVCWAAEADTIMIVGASGTANRIMSASGFSNVTLDSWTVVNPGQSRSDTEYVEGVYSLKIVGDSVEEFPGLMTQPILFDSEITYIISGRGYVPSNQTGSLKVDIYSDSTVIKEIEFVPDDSGFVYVTTTINFEVAPLDTLIRIYGAGTPNSEPMYLDLVAVQRQSDYEISTSGNAILTTGTVETVPDISVEAQGVLSSASGTTSETVSTPVTITDTYYVYSSLINYKYELETTKTIAAKTGVKIRVDKVALKAGVESSGTTCYSKVEVFFAGTLAGTYYFTSTSYPTNNYTNKSASPNLTSAEGQAVTIKYWIKSSSTSKHAYIRNISYTYSEISSTTTVAQTTAGISIHNTSDPLTILRLCNKIYPGIKISVNADGTGSIKFLENFSDATYQSVVTSRSGDTYSSTLKRVSLTGSLVWEFDSLNPVTGIPHVVMYVNSGVPKLEISTDNSTWYACDSNTLTSYTDSQIAQELDNAANLRLYGKTKFYLRVSPASGTLVISSLYMFSYLITIDSEHPVINPTGAAETFEITMTNDIPCKITMKYHDKHWAV